MTISTLPTSIVVLLVAMMSSAHAQTGKDLFDVCTSKNTIEQMSCAFYISGFVHGLQAAEDLKSTLLPRFVARAAMRLTAPRPGAPKHKE